MNNAKSICLRYFATENYGKIFNLERPSSFDTTIGCNVGFYLSICSVDSTNSHLASNLWLSPPGNRVRCGTTVT